MPKDHFKFFHPLWLILLGIHLIQADITGDTLTLLRHGDQNIVSKQFNEVVLVFGTAGSGKTSLTKFIADLDEKLFAVKLPNGNIVIQDISALGSSNIVAKENVFTELYVDETTNVPYYNMPSVSSNRNSKSDITSAYFINKAMSSVSSIKIVFALDNLDKLNDLIQYTSQFFKSFNEFQNSVALILTKVSNDGIISEAVTKLNAAKRASSSVKEKQLISAMLQNIGVFMRPREAGKLSDLPDMIDNKNHLKEYISNMRYTEIKSDNLDYSFLYQKWSQEISQVLDRINLLKSKVVNQKVQEYFKGEETRFYDFKQFRVQIAQREQRMIEIIESLKEMSDPFDVEKQVLKYLYEIIFEIPKELSLYSEISDFLVATNSEQLKRKSTEWINQLQSTVDYLKDLKNVFNVFNIILDSLKVSWWSLRIWAYGNTTRDEFNAKRLTGVKIKGGDLKDFTNNVYGRYLTTEHQGYYNSIENVVLNDVELGILYEIFEEAALTKKTTTCTDDELIIEGNYVTMADVHNSNCIRKKTSISVFNSFYYDVSNYEVDIDQAEIAIISPNWEIPNYAYLKVGKQRVNNARDYGGAIMTIGGVYGQGHSLHMYSFGGEIDNFGPLYNNIRDADRPCGILNKRKSNSFSDDINLCKENFRSMMNMADGHMFSNRGRALIRYKNAIINNLQNRYQRNESLTFLSALNEIDDIYHFFRAPDFVEELRILEKHYQTFKNKELLKPLYQNLQFWIVKTINHMKGTASTVYVDFKIIFRYLYSVTLGKIIAINSNSANTFIVDIDLYLDYILDNIDLMRENQMQVAVDNTKSKYQEQLNHKIEEGKKFIENHIAPRIQQVQGHIISVTENDFIEEIKQVELTVKEQMKEIKAKMWQVAIAGILGFVGTICTIFGGPIGIAVGTMMNMGSAVVSSLNVGDKSTKMHQVPQDLQNKLDSVQQFIGDYEKEREEVYSATMKYLKGAQVYDKAIEDAYTKAVEIKAVSPDDRLKLTHGILDDHIKKLKASDPKSPALAKFKAAKSFANVAEVGTKVFLQVKDDVDKISSLSDLLEEKEKELENLKKLRATVSEQFVPLLKNVTKELNEKLASLKKESRISLDVHKWRIKEALSDLRTQLQTLTNGFQVQAEILTYVSKLGEAIELVIAIFDKIQTYEEHKRFSDYIADITHPKVDFNEAITDPALRKAKDELDLMLKRNVLLENYQNAISGLKQHVFPFAEMYLERNAVSFTINDNENIDQTITRVGNHVREMKTKLKRFKSTIQRDYQDIQKYSFYSYRTYHPFFVWRNDEYGSIIKNLLSGEQVVLKADITSSTKNAVKFNKIDLQFKSYNADVQREINDLLLDFEVNITHMGNSYYKCDDKIFVVHSQSLNIRYGFAKTEDGKLRTENQVNQILQDSYFMLSPYAMWTIQLKSNRQDGFAQLKQLSNTVSLELSGDGQYVSDNAPICKTDLESYYQLDSTYYLRKNNLLE